MRTEETPAITALKAAVPYLRRFQGATFVLKASGEAFADQAATDSLVEQVGVLHRLGIRVVLVHGGRAEITELSSALGHETRIVDGRRVTDASTREAAVMVLNGTVNTRIVAACRRLGVPAVGLSGVDAQLVQATRRPPAETRSEGTVDYGYVGDVTAVDPTAARLLLDGGFVPVFSPLACDADGQVLNVNGDVTASRLAVALDAAKWIVLTGARGILMDPDDPGSLVSYTDLAGLAELDTAGSLGGGMLPKVAAIRNAIEGGVRRVHVIGYAQPDSLLTEVFTNEGSGTMVVADLEDVPAEEASF